MDVREVLFITQETHNDDHKNSEIEEINSKEGYDEETRFDSFWGGKDITKSEQEDDQNLEKLNHVENENSNLRNKNREFGNELENCEEENHKLENKINNLKEKL
jgi:septal ring factor EnvC (AmiA/AmiB activator)